MAVVDPNRKRKDKVLRHYGMSPWHARLLQRMFCTFCVTAYRADHEQLHAHCSSDTCQCRNPVHNRTEVTTESIRALKETVT